jgi:hypothetical protein
LGVARYLTTDQVLQLVFPGRSPTTVRLRMEGLAGLSSGREIREPLVKKLLYRTYAGDRVVVWGLTGRGYSAAAELLPPHVPELVTPTHDVSADFLEHETETAELYVRLVRPPQSIATGYVCVPKAWRWIAGGLVRIPFGEYQNPKAETKTLAYRLQPDAVLELPRARIFVEYETGTVSLKDDKPGSIRSKLGRYCQFFITGPRDLGARATMSWYQQVFRDARLQVPETLAGPFRKFWPVDLSARRRVGQGGGFDRTDHP